MRHPTHDCSAYLGGKRRDSDRTATITDLTSGDVFASAAVTDEATAEAAVVGAQSATQEMHESTLPERAAWCRDIADALRERADTLTDVLVRESGKPVTSARAEVNQAADRFDYVAGELHELGGEYRTWTSADRTEWNSMVTAAPLGVVVSRPSAESPLGTAVLQVAPALAAGNSVVIQPAKTTPVSASILTDLLAESDVPTGAIAYLPEPTSVASQTLTTHDDVAAVLQSGPSRAVGRNEKADGTVRLRIALDGNAPAVVLDDADIASTSETIADGGLRHPGHRSPGTGSVVVHESQSQRLVDRLDARIADWEQGDLFDEGTVVAPLVDHGRAKRVDELVTDAVDRGATLVRGGDLDGREYEPTLLAEVPPDAKVHRERAGPVVAVTTVDSQAAAATVLNGLEYARAPSVFTESHERAMAFADLINTRAVRINGASDRGPCGGVVGTTGSNNHGLHETLACLTRRKRVIH